MEPKSSSSPVHSAFSKDLVNDRRERGIKTCPFLKEKASVLTAPQMINVIKKFDVGAFRIKSASKNINLNFIKLKIVSFT